MRNLVVCSVHVKMIKSKLLEWARHMVRMEEGRGGVLNILTVKSTGDRPIEIYK